MIKNVIAYAVTPGFKLDPELLRRQTAHECGANQSHAEGFIAPCPHSTAELAHHVAGYTVICWQTEDKILPGSVVEEAVAERCAEIEETQGYKPGRKQRKEIKEQVIDTLLPRAFVQKRRTLALFGGGYLIINTPSPARAEALIECLRKALEGLPLSRLRTTVSVGAAMAAWLSESEGPANLSIDQDAALSNAEDAKVSYSNKQVVSSATLDLLADGYRPTKLGLTYADRLSFLLNDQFGITRLSLLDVLSTTEAHMNAKDAAEIFDIDITLEAGEIIRLLDFLIAEFGGLWQPDGDQKPLPLKEAA